MRVPLPSLFGKRAFCSGKTVVSFGTPIVGPRKSALGKMGSSGASSARRVGPGAGVAADGAADGEADGDALALGTAIGGTGGAVCARAASAVEKSAASTPMY